MSTSIRMPMVKDVGSRFKEMVAALGFGLHTSAALCAGRQGSCRGTWVAPGKWPVILKPAAASCGWKAQPSPVHIVLNACCLKLERLPSSERLLTQKVNSCRAAACLAPVSMISESVSDNVRFRAGAVGSRKTSED